MFKFFRRLRQNLIAQHKFTKYLLYAVGEIILVVIGILIAINLNNSNQQKTVSKNVDSQLTLLRQAVYQDSISTSGVVNYSIKQVADARRLLKILKEPLNVQSCQEFISEFRNHIEIRTIIADRSIYDEMVNSGAFSKIEQPQLKAQIATYYQLSAHFDDVVWLMVGDFRAFNNQIALDGTIARSYFDDKSGYTEQEKCAYITSLLGDAGRIQILENYIYAGIDTYEQIINLNSVLINNFMTGLPLKSE